MFLIFALWSRNKNNRVHPFEETTRQSTESVERFVMPSIAFSSEFGPVELTDFGIPARKSTLMSWVDAIPSEFNPVSKNECIFQETDDICGGLLSSFSDVVYKGQLSFTFSEIKLLKSRIIFVRESITQSSARLERVWNSLALDQALSNRRSDNVSPLSDLMLGSGIGVGNKYFALARRHSDVAIDMSFWYILLNSVSSADPVQLIEVLMRAVGQITKPEP